jgi:hypothetical protein
MKGHRSIVALLCSFLFTTTSCNAFTTIPLITSQTDSKTILWSENNDEHDNHFAIGGRRSFLALATPLLSGGFSIVSATTASRANAADELFKTNPLTNPLLEQVRIWEQAEADDIKYRGELAPGDAGNKGKVDAYPKLLVPILEMERDLQKVDSLVHGGRDDWKEGLKILQQSKFEKLAFKKTFNSFGDNIYYSDPDRANLYLGGGTTPKTEQSLAYLLRNEILTIIEDLQAELMYQLKANENDTEELYRLSTDATSAMKQYIDNVSPSIVKQARDLLAAKG